MIANPPDPNISRIEIKSIRVKKIVNPLGLFRIHNPNFDWPRINREEFRPKFYFPFRLTMIMRESMVQRYLLINK